MQVCRFPIIPAIEAALNVLSLGQFGRNKKALGYDKIFHLYTLLKVQSPRQRGAGSINYIRVEKNEVLNIEHTTLSGKNPGDAPNEAFGSGCKKVNLGAQQARLTLGEFLERGLKRAGPNHFFVYDPALRNCQEFTANLLTANKLITPALRSFITQEGAQLLTGFAKSIGLQITNLAARANILLHGEGL